MLLTINTKTLYNLRPEKIAGIAVCVFIVLLIMAPVNIKNTLDIASLLYIISCLLSFWLGTKLIRTRKIKPYAIPVNRKHLRFIYRTTFILGVIGILFKVTDLVVYRNIAIGNTIMDNFENAREIQGSIFSVLSALFIYFAYVPFTLDFVCGTRSKKKKAISVLLLLSTGISSLFFGSRNAISIPLLYMIIVLLYTKTIKISFKWFVIAAIAAITGLYVISYLFIKRLEEMNITVFMASASETEGYSDKVPANTEYIQLMQENKDGFLLPYLFGYLHVSQYFIHAIFEFPVVKEYIDIRKEYYYGAATLGVITKFFQRISGSADDITKTIQDHNARPGIWSTFFFLWYLDFGWIGTLIMIWFGYACKKIWAAIYYGRKILYLPLLFYMTIILLFILQFNMIYGAGLYAIVSFLLLPHIQPLKWGTAK